MKSVVELGLSQCPCCHKLYCLQPDFRRAPDYWDDSDFIDAYESDPANQCVSCSYCGWTSLDE
jgi:hypothetical protein